MNKKTKRILDTHISDSNFAKFDKCEVMRNGSAVRFNYPSEYSYEVDIRDILSWFERPHYTCQSGHVEDWGVDRFYIPPSRLRIKFVRRVLSGHALRIYMTDATAYDVAWDTVLMACESRYQWFGGLPGEVKTLMGKW